LYDTRTIPVHQNQIILSTYIFLFGGKRVPFTRSLIALRDTTSNLVQTAHIVLSSRMVLFGKGRLFTHRNCKVTTVCSIQLLLEISTPRHPHISKKHDNHQAVGVG
jgi:hypothetical protein